MIKYTSGIRDVIFGEGVTVVEPSNIYECTLDEHCFVGPFVEIQKNVSVGARTRIQSHSFICSNVTIGSDCFIGHGVMFTNDLFEDGCPAMGDATKWRFTQIGNNVSIGSNTVLLPVNICDSVVIGAGSVVTRDINEPGTYYGNPCKRNNR